MPRRSRVKVRAAAECHAEVALCRLFSQQLARLNRKCHIEITEKDIDHKPRKGGRERVIAEAVRRACRHGYSLLLVVDYEKERASRRYVERICRHGLVAWSGGGAAIKICGGVVEVPWLRCSVRVAAVVNDPRVEDVLVAIRGRGFTVRERKRVKRDADYVYSIVARSERGRELVKAVAERLSGLLCGEG